MINPPVPLLLTLLPNFSTIAPPVETVGTRPKTAQFHVFSPTGAVIGSWRDVATLPSWSWPINGGQGVMSLTLPRAWAAAGELGESGSREDLAMENRVDTYIVDKESGSFGDLQFSGRLQRYVVNEPADQGAQVWLFPKTTRFQDAVIEGPVTYTQQDPTTIMQDVVDNYLPGIDWDPSNPLVGLKYDLTLENMKVVQALEVIRRLGGSQWFYRLNPDDTFTFDAWNLNAPADHVLNGNDFAGARFQRSSEDIKTRVFLFGAKEVRDDDGKITQPQIKVVVTSTRYDVSDPRDLFHVDTRITDFATATRVARSLLEYYRETAIETEIDIPDSNYDSVKGYDIESLKPGQTLKLLHPRLVYRKPKYNEGHLYDNGERYNGVWAGLVQGPLVIANVQYKYTSATVSLTNRPASVIEALLAVSDRQLLEGSA